MIILLCTFDTLCVKLFVALSYAIDLPAVLKYPLTSSCRVLLLHGVVTSAVAERGQRSV